MTRRPIRSRVHFSTATFLSVAFLFLAPLSAKVFRSTFFMGRSKRFASASHSSMNCWWRAFPFSGTFSRLRRTSSLAAFPVWMLKSLSLGSIVELGTRRLLTGKLQYWSILCQIAFKNSKSFESVHLKWCKTLARFTKYRKIIVRLFSVPPKFILSFFKSMTRNSQVYLRILLM